jgi:hypothetical protein
MSETDLRTIANRANQAYAADAGFIGCYVESETPPVLAYDFDNADHAEEFRFRREIQSSAFRLKIGADRPSTVLEYR